MTPRPTRSRTIIRHAVALTALTLLAGCHSASVPGGGGTVRTVVLEDFVDGNGSTATASTATAPTATRVETPAPTDVAPPAVTDANPAMVARSDTPAPPLGPGATATTDQDGPNPIPPIVEPRQPNAVVSGERIIVDAMVGQVNGKPIFADEFLIPIEDQLIALRRQVTNQSEYLQRANPIISRHLQQTVQNALLLAEAESELTIEQQQGLFHLLKQWREETVAEYGRGTGTSADERLREEENKTLDEYVQGVREEQLIRKVLYENVAPRIVVSWRDVEREYARRAKEYNTPGQVTFARIRIPTSQTARLDAVRTRLAAGDDFLAIADDVGAPYATREWQVFEVPEGGLSAIEFGDAVRNALAPLDAAGQTTDAIEIGTSVMWIHIARLDPPTSRSLYDPDVQRELRVQIRSQRTRVEQQRYLESLLEDGIYDALDDMGQRLLLIAAVRYGP